MVKLVLNIPSLSSSSSSEKPFFHFHFHCNLPHTWLPRDCPSQRSWQDWPDVAGRAGTGSARRIPNPAQALSPNLSNHVFIFFNSILTQEPWKTLQLSAENLESKTKLELTGKTAIQVKSNPTQACQALSAMFSNFGHKNHVLLQLYFCHLSFNIDGEQLRNV